VILTNIMASRTLVLFERFGEHEGTAMGALDNGEAMALR